MCVMSQKENKTVLSIQDWKALVLDSFRAFPRIWWRIGTITLLVFMLVGAGALLFGVLQYALLGGIEQVQNVMANIKMGGSLTIYEGAVVWGTFIFGALWMITAIVLGKVGNLLVLKAHIDKEKQYEVNPFKVYFTRGWDFLIRYITLFIRMVWYACWAALLATIVYAGVISFFSQESFFSVLGLLVFWLVLVFFKYEESVTLELSSEFQRLVAFVPDYLNVLFVLIGIGVFAFVVYRGFRTAFVQQALIHFNNKSVNKTFSTAVNMFDNIWWRVVLSIFSYFILINVVRVFFLLPEILMNYEIMGVRESLLKFMQSLDLLFSLFVLMPLMICFMYTLMIYVAQAKKVKL